MLKLATIALLVAVPNAALAENWVIDYSSSSIEFSIETSSGLVTGDVQNWTADIEASGMEFASAKIDADLDQTSIQTDFPLADPILRSEPWLNSEAFPNARFVSLSFTVGNAPTAGLLTGELTIKGETRPFSVHVNWTLEGRMVVAELSGELNRLAFGIGDEASVDLAESVVWIEGHLEAERQ